MAQHTQLAAAIARTLRANRTGGAAYPGSGRSAGNTAQGVGSTRTKPQGPKPPRKPRNPSRPDRPHKPKRSGGQGLNAGNYGGALGYKDALKLANQIAGVQFNPQITQAQGLANNVPAYFDQYRQALTNAQGQTSQLSQPLLAQAQQAQTNVGQPLGLTGEAGQNDQLAAASRANQQAMMAQALQGVANANSNYYTQSAANSYGAQNTAAQQLSQQIAGLKASRGATAAQQLLGIRNDDRNYNLEVQTLLGNQAADVAKARNDRASIRAGVTKARIDARVKRAAADIKNKADRAKFIAQYGITPEEAQNGLSPAERKIVRRMRHGTGSSSSGKDQFGNTPRDVRRYNDDWTRAKRLAKGLVKPGVTADQVYGFLLEDQTTLPPVLAHAAAQFAVNGHIGAGIRAKALTLGVKLPVGNTRRRTGATGNMAPGANGQTRPT